MNLYLPETPTQGQRYVATNGITYTWIDNRWNGTLALAQGVAEYYVDNGDAFFTYNILTNNQLDGGTA
jgi:hypothetical protein